MDLQSYYNGNEFVVEDLMYLPYMGNNFNISKNQLYRFKITEIKREVESTTHQFV